MKLKYYLRGLGLGIIFTSIILAVAYSQNKGLTSDSEIMKRASELGMISPETENNELFETEGTEDTGTETKDGEETASVDSQKPQTTQQSEAPTSQQTEVQTSQQEETSQQVSQIADSQQTAESTDDPEYMVIEVEPGEVCRQIAEDLEAHGLVDDAETFRKYMEQKNYDNYIRVGKFPIKKGASFEEIAIALTTKQ